MTNTQSNSNLSVEMLINGYIRVFDRACQWALLYNRDGSYRHGQVDKCEYRAAVAEFLAR